MTDTSLLERSREALKALCLADDDLRKRLLDAYVEQIVPIEPNHLHKRYAPRFKDLNAKLTSKVSAVKTIKKMSEQEVVEIAEELFNFCLDVIVDNSRRGPGKVA